jgi:hypothetical protein
MPSDLRRIPLDKEIFEEKKGGGGFEAKTVYCQQIIIIIRSVVPLGT